MLRLQTVCSRRASLPVNTRRRAHARKTKELLREYEGGKISRRDFMRQAVITTGSLAAANSLIGGLLPRDSYAAQVDPNDPAILTHMLPTKGKPGRWLAI